MAQQVAQELVEAARGFGFEIRDPQRFAQNMARLVEETGKAVTAFVEPRVSNPAQPLARGGDFTHIMNALSQIAGLALPAAEAHGGAGGAVAALLAIMDVGPRDPDQRWHRGACRHARSQGRALQGPCLVGESYLDFMKQAYLINSRWAERLVEQAENVDPDTRHKAGFYMKQVINALAPSNWVFTNPELLRETFASDGENLVRGMQLLAEDIRRGGGDLQIRQTDFSKFELGRNLAITPGKVVFQTELFQLIQYAATTETVLKRPLLIVPPWINKFYILDLNPEKSFIKWAVSQGHTVFVISWVNPDERLANKTFEDYMREGVFEAIKAVCEATGEESVNAIGYCVGGTLLAIALAAMAASSDKRIRSVTFFTTQVDFKHAGDLKVFSDEKQIEEIEREMNAKGYLDSSKMATIFNLLRSNDLIWPYIVYPDL